MRLHAVKAWYDSREGMVELEDDVLSIVRQVRELYGEKITIEVDPIEAVYHFVEHGEDHTDRLIFSTKLLDGRALERLMRADSHSRAYEDPYEAAEHEQDKLQQEHDEAFKEQLREHGEQLAHALKREGKAESLPLQVAIPTGVDGA